MLKKQFIYPSALTIAGFDGSGGAGIQADIKTFSALGCYATSVLTALPVQNTMGVRRIYPLPEEAVRDQIETIMDDVVPLAIKVGMVPSAALAKLIATVLNEYPARPLVLDPVMVASSGHKLIEDETVRAMIRHLFPLAHIVTPNLDEAAALAGMEVRNISDMQVAGKRIQGLGCREVLLKGGHLDSPSLTSLYFDFQGEVHSFEFERIDTRNTHGTGCTLSSAIAAYLARGSSLYEAVDRGQQYVHQAIKEGLDVQTGKGKGPLNHFFDPLKLIKKPLS